MTTQFLLTSLRMVMFYVAWPTGLMLYPRIASAATITFGQGFLLIPALAWIAVLLLSTLAGVTALLLRVSARLDMQEKGIEPVRRTSMVLFAAAHMCGSWTAGLVIFLLAIHSETPEWLVGVGILLASFMGAKFLEKAADAWFTSKVAK